MQDLRNATMVDRSMRSVDHPSICAVLRCQIYRPLLGHPVRAVSARKEDVFLPLGPVSARVSRSPRPRRSAVALRHVAFEDLGFLSAILDRVNWTVSYCDAAVSDLRDPILQEADLLIVLGGPIGVYESEAQPFLLNEISLLERRLAQDQPTLGICLGSQLMARALGARVFAGPTKEI
jgi:putative intracellular protease/amidase